MTADLDRSAVRDEMEQARQEFRRLVGKATRADLARRPDGTRRLDAESEPAPLRRGR